MKIQSLYINRIYFILLTKLLFVSFGCVHKESNQEVIERGIDVINNSQNDLNSILPICDSLFNNRCNVFQIINSPTTDLFLPVGLIDNLHTIDGINSPSQSQQDRINKLMPKKVSNVIYLKDVFVAFYLSNVKHEKNGILLTRINDMDKFLGVYSVTTLKNKYQSNPKIDWIFPIKDDWFVTSFNPIHSGKSNICSLLDG